MIAAPDISIFCTPFDASFFSKSGSCKHFYTCSARSTKYATSQLHEPVAQRTGNEIMQYDCLKECSQKLLPAKHMTFFWRLPLLKNNPGFAPSERVSQVFSGNSLGDRLKDVAASMWNLIDFLGNLKTSFAEHKNIALSLGLHENEASVIIK